MFVSKIFYSMEMGYVKVEINKNVIAEKSSVCGFRWMFAYSYFAFDKRFYLNF